MLSAGSAAIEARDPKTQAIMMLRGKTLSVLKSTDDKVYSNAVYKDLIAAIGAGIGKTFDVNKMNYNKIVITSDAKQYWLCNTLPSYQRGNKVSLCLGFLLLTVKAKSSNTHANTVGNSF